jgi:hypothetical protein
MGREGIPASIYSPVFLKLANSFERRGTLRTGMLGVQYAAFRELHFHKA